MHLDSPYLAEQLRFIRKKLGLTQENLAEMCGITTRTIEKLESGRHLPSEQTLKSLARGLKLDASIFMKPSPEEEAAEKAKIDKALRECTIVPTRPIHTISDFLAACGECDAFRWETGYIEDEEAESVAATMVDYIKDYMEIWPDMGATNRLECAKSFMDYCKSLEALGYVCHMGRHRQREIRKNPVTFDVGLMTFLGTEASKTAQYAFIQLPDGWEVPEEDRPKQSDSEGKS